MKSFCEITLTSTLHSVGHIPLPWPAGCTSISASPLRTPPSTGWTWGPRAARPSWPSDATVRGAGSWQPGAGQAVTQQLHLAGLAFG